MSNQNSSLLTRSKILAFLCLICIIVSCNNDDGNKSTSPSTEKKVSPLSATLPTFIIAKEQLPPLQGNPNNPRPSKFIIQYKFDNINNPGGTMKLWLYAANDHAHYGANTEPIEATVLPGTVTLDISSVVLAHNELLTQNFVSGNPLEYQFAYLKLTPKKSQFTKKGIHYLIFEVVALNAAKHVIATLNSVDTNPCPPNQPGN